jgi:tetratricopeptide (TPR) repeat protein
MATTGEIKRTGERVTDKMERFIQKNRKLLLVILGVVLLGLIGYGIYTEIVDSARVKATIKIEALQDQFDAWRTEGDATKKAALEKTLESSAQALIAAYPKQYVAQRAYTLMGDYYYDKKDFQKSGDEYGKAATDFPKNYLSAVSLFNAAVVAEEKGDEKAAIDLYGKLVKDFEKTTPLVPHALFSLGRLNESQKDFAKAVEAYSKLQEKYPEESWTKMAKDRIIYLTAQGLWKK